MTAHGKGKHKRHHTAHVLIIDDSRTARSFFSKAVALATDAPILSVGSAEEGLDILRSGTEVGTIILDHHLPGISGKDMLALIQQNQQWSAIPVLITTGAQYDENLVSECIRLGAADFMEKQYRPEIFKARIHRSIESYYSRKQGEELKQQLAQAVESQKKLLSNTLPPRISDELMETGRFRPLQCRDAAVLFADVCGFTNFTKDNSSIKLVSNLNRLINRLERISDDYGLEKIKTIGDAYMAVSGVLDEGYDLARVIDAGFQAIRETRELEIGWEVKIGIATGPLIAGIIGSKRIQFDVWGNTVNLAARMCNASSAGLLAIPLNQLNTLDNPPPIFQQDERDVKGIGMVDIAILKLPESTIAD